MTERHSFVSATWIALAAVAALALAALVEPLIAAAGGTYLPAMTARSCSQVGSHGGLAGIAAFGVAALGAAVALRGVPATLAVARAGRATARLDADPVALNGDRVWILPTPRPVAFSAGLLRPRTYLSAGVLAGLGDAELGAVLAHERHHRRRRDPLRRGLRHALCESFFFVASLRRLCQERDEDAEAAADAAALRDCGDDARPLAAALLRFAEVGGPAVSPRRVDRLHGKARDGVGTPGLLAAVAAALALLAFAISVVVFEPGRPVHLCATETTLLVGIAWSAARRRGAARPAQVARRVAAT